MLFLSNWNARRKHSHRPTNHTRPCRKTSTVSNPIFRLSGRWANPASKLSASSIAGSATYVSSGNHIHPGDQRFEIRWIVVRVVDSEDGAITNHNLAARIDKSVRLLWLNLLSTETSTSSSTADHAHRVAMKFVDRDANLSQRIAQSLLLLPLHRDLHERHCAERQDRHHGNRDHQFDQRETAFGSMRRSEQRNAATSSFTSIHPVAALLGCVLPVPF
jgi:hypothetical protein